MVYFRKYDRFLISVMLAFLSFPAIVLSQSRTISASVQVTATAINRFISAQTFPTLNGSASGYTYYITITSPVVQLNTNSATVQFTIQANTSAGNYTFNVQPTITIPNLSVTVSQIIATLQGFGDMIYSRTDIPSWLKPVIISGYNNLNLVMYPSKLIDYANSAVPDFINIQVTDIGVSFTVAPGAMTFTLSVVAQGTPPVFTAQWMKRGVGQLSVRFGGNVATMVKQVRIYDVNSTEVYRNDNLNISVPNDGYCVQIDPTSYISVTTYYISVIFHSPYGQYARRYYFSFNTATYNTWFPTTLGSSIN